MKATILSKEMDRVCRVFRHIPIRPSPIKAYSMVQIEWESNKILFSFRSGNFQIQYEAQVVADERVEQFLIPVSSMKLFGKLCKCANAITLSKKDGILYVSTDWNGSAEINTFSCNQDLFQHELPSELLTMLSSEEMKMLGMFRQGEFSDNDNSILSREILQLGDHHHILSWYRDPFLSTKDNFSYQLNENVSRLLYGASVVEHAMTVHTDEKHNILFFAGEHIKMVFPTNEKQVFQKESNHNLCKWEVYTNELLSILNNIQPDKKNYVLDSHLVNGQWHIAYQDKLMKQKVSIPYIGENLSLSFSCNIRFFQDIIKGQTSNKLYFWLDQGILFLRGDNTSTSMLALIIRNKN